MRPLRVTLYSDGSRDRILLPVIRWLLQDLGVTSMEPKWADPYLFPKGTQGLAGKAMAAVDREPCDILFVHRDAEGIPLEDRVREIRDQLRTQVGGTPYICLIPVRMSEAWFLFHEQAIRAAASNPGGIVQLDLPALNKVESLPDPKQVLHEALRKATNLKGRHLDRFMLVLNKAVHRVAEIIDDYSPLRQLSAFRAFEAEVADCLGIIRGFQNGNVVP